MYLERGIPSLNQLDFGMMSQLDQRGLPKRAAHPGKASTPAETQTRHARQKDTMLGLHGLLVRMHLKYYFNTTTAKRGFLPKGQKAKQSTHHIENDTSDVSQQPREKGEWPGHIVQAVRLNPLPQNSMSLTGSTIAAPPIHLPSEHLGSQKFRSWTIPSRHRHVGARATGARLGTSVVVNVPVSVAFRVCG
ncbi:hypothetical protein LZ30DRAFT_335875 [Colletotrichum cereale]|nr:hypothetical protein LZ30DRAFT_335875 [Colletotrichum cereale]